jgi:tRNA (cmo5U34)-methyltransferase
MAQPDPAILFDRNHAATYDERFARLAPFRNAMLLVARIALAELPERARVLCVGAGTGTELIALADAFPHRRFAAVEPAPAMLEVCRERVAQAGLASRCELFRGYLHEMPETEPFDAATCLLVSQFVTDPTARTALFAEIARRLRPGAILVSVDLAIPNSRFEGADPLALWTETLRYNGMTDEQLAGWREAVGRAVAVLPVPQVEAIIAAAGFLPPVPCFQAGRERPRVS